MSRWSIQIPYRHRDDDIDEVAFAARALPDADDRAVLTELVVSARLDGCRSAGDLLDRIAGATAVQRRRMLDDAREAIGLERSEDIDRRERFEMTQQMAARRSNGRDASGAADAGCAAEGCNAMPLGSTGLPERVTDRLWWCPAHRHLAGPDDHLPPHDVTRIGPHFEEIPAPSIQRRMEAEDEQRRQEEEKRRRDRHAEAEATRRARERWIEEHRDDPYVNPWSGPGWRAAP
jgi:hypothetical protein